MISTRSKNWLAHELRRLRGFPMQQTLAVTRAAAASRPPHTAKIGSHSSSGRFAASAHNKLLLSHELRPLRGLRAQQALAVTRAAAASRPPRRTSSCCHTSCGCFAATAHNKALRSYTQALAVAQATAAARPPHTSQTLTLTRAAASALADLRPLHSLRINRAQAVSQPLLQQFSGRYTASASSELRPLRGLRFNRALSASPSASTALQPHRGLLSSTVLRPLCGLCLNRTKPTSLPPLRQRSNRSESASTVLCPLRGLRFNS